MSNDTRIDRSLRDAAEHAIVPPLDIEALRAGGRRHARRRTAAALGAASLVLAVVGGGVVIGSDALRTDGQPGPVKQDDLPQPSPPKRPKAPMTVADLPQGDAPALPYLVDDVMHAGGAQTDLDGYGQVQGLRYGGSVTLGYYPTRGIAQVGDDGNATVLDPESQSLPAVSPSGSLAAWPGTTGADGTEIVVWSVSEGREVDRFTVPEQPECCDSGFRVAGVADNGTVYVSGDKAHYVVDGTDGDAVAIEGLDPGNDTIVVSAEGLVVLSAPTSKAGDGRARLGEIVEGRFRSDIEHTGTDVSWASWWSPYDVDLMVSRSVLGGIRTYALDGDMYETPEPVAVPARAEVEDVAWESADAMLVQVTEDGHAWWLRCYIQAGGCERAADLGEGGEFTIPRR
jgi:hypothetical protein